MEIISSEEIITSLFITGFDKVDTVLFTFTLAAISLSEAKYRFKYADKQVSPFFKRFVDNNHLVYQLKRYLGSCSKQTFQQ